MTAMDLLRSAAALAAVLGVIVLGAWILRRTRLTGGPTPLGRGRRLHVTEAAMVDARRKAAVLRWRDREYLVVFSGEQGIAVADRREVEPTDHDQDDGAD